jgi:hypothetical protein
MPRRTRAHDTSKATRHKAQPVLVRNMAHPRIWKTALKLAGGDKGKITVDSYSKLSIVID